MAQEGVIEKSALTPTVLIVGGAGFIGSHLAEAFLQKDVRVVVLDNFSTGKDVFVHSLLENPKFALYNADINQGIPQAIKSVDYIFHVAGLESYLFDKDDLNLDSLLTNALGTRNVLDFCKKSVAKMLLASSIDVYKGMISPLDLDHYFGQTSYEEKKYSLAEAKRYAEALVWEYYKKHAIDVRIARFPEIYGPRMNLTSSGSLGIGVKNLIDNKDLVVYGDGVEKEYYLYIADAISALNKALFTDNTAGKIYTFMPKETHTALEINYVLKSFANSETKVTFKNKLETVRSTEPHMPDKNHTGDLNWQEKIDFKTGIVETLKWLGYEPNNHSFKPNKLIQKKEEKSEPKAVGVLAQPASNFTIQESKINDGEKKQKPKKRGFLKKVSPDFKRGLILVVTFLFVFIGIPIVQTAIHGFLGFRSLQKAETQMTALNTVNALPNFNAAYGSFYKSEKALSRIRWLFSITGTSAYYNDAQRIQTSLRYASKAGYFASKGATPLTSFWTYIKPDSQESLDTQAFQDALTGFSNAKDNVNLALAELSGVKTALFQAKTANYVPVLQDFYKKTELLVVLASDFPQLIGLEEDKSYLLLFQNSNELRPTGGFIGSYATLDLKDGKIANLSIDDVYNPDGQIDEREIEVTPPEPITTYLDEEVLHIRNANWDPSFPESADTILNLFGRVDGRKYDGVIALDLYVVEKILRVTGPIYLAAYDEEITADNLYERTQFHSEFSYTDGSDQKRAFLTVLGGKLLERVFSLENTELLAFMNTFEESLAEKHLLVYLPNNSIGTFLKSKAWDGGLVSAQNQDYLYVVNTNLGGTKANYYVQDAMNYNVFSATRDGMLRAELTLKYDHTGESTAWPGGPYTDYVRVYVPYGAKLTGGSITFSDASHPSSGSGGTVQDVFEDVLTTSYTSNAYTIFEIGFVLQPQQHAEVKLAYDLPENLVFTQDSSAYNLYWQKQPGTHDDPVTFRFNAPFAVSVTNATPAMTIGNATAEYKGILNTDTHFNLSFD